MTSWNQFDTLFLVKFGDEKTPETLMLELAQINMNNKERIKDFNQRQWSYNRFLTNSDMAFFITGWLSGFMGNVV